MSGSFLGRRCSKRQKRNLICPLGNYSVPSPKRIRQTSFALLTTPKVIRRKKTTKCSLAKKSVKTANKKIFTQNTKIESSRYNIKVDVVSTPVLNSNRISRSGRFSSTNKKLPEVSKRLTRSSSVSSLPFEEVKTKIKSKASLETPHRKGRTRSREKETKRITRSCSESVLVTPSSEVSKRKSIVEHRSKEKKDLKTAERTNQRLVVKKASLETNFISTSSRPARKNAAARQDKISISNVKNKEGSVSHKQTKGKFDNCETSRQKRKAIPKTSRSSSRNPMLKLKTIPIDAISFSPPRQKRTNLRKSISSPTPGLSVKRKSLRGNNLDTLILCENSRRTRRCSVPVIVKEIFVTRKNLQGKNLDTLVSCENGRRTRSHTGPVIEKDGGAVKKKTINNNCPKKNQKKPKERCSSSPKNTRKKPHSLGVCEIQEDCLTANWKQDKPTNCKGTKSKKSVQSTPRIKRKLTVKQKGKSRISVQTTPRVKRKPTDKQKGKSLKPTLDRESDDSGTFSSSSTISTPDYSKLPIDDLVALVGSSPFSFKKGLNKKNRKCLSTPTAPKRKAASMPAVNKPNLLTKSSVKEIKKKTSLPAGSVSSVPKGKGTLKRKRWMLNALREKNDGYEDDLFECQKFDYLTKAMKNFDDESDSSVSISTPKFGCILSPMLPKKTPRYKDCISPSDLLFARKNAEEYLFRRNKKRKTGLPVEEQSTSLQTPSENDAEIPERKQLEFANAMNVLTAFRKSVESDGDTDDDDYFSDVSV